MNWQQACAAVIPCFNEAEHIGKLVTAVQGHLPKIVVVDDGSADATADLARAAGKTVEFVPVQTVYQDSASKINPVTDTWRWLCWRLAQGFFFRACKPMRVP